MDGYADDLAAVIETLDLKDVTAVGHSTGGGEVARYIGRHGTKRLAAAVLIAAVPPIMVESAANPNGIPIEVFDGSRSGLAKDRSQFYKDFALPFYGANRPGAKVSQGLLDQFWLWSMQGGLKNIYDSVKAFSETDFTEDLKKFDVPTLIQVRAAPIQLRPQKIQRSGKNFIDVQVLLVSGTACQNRSDTRNNQGRAIARVNDFLNCCAHLVQVRR
jgi:pimeloyl-ACP methyl ester carboxylesterase